MFTSATSGAAIIELSIERGNTDADSDSFATVKFVSVTPNATSGIETIAQIDFDETEIDGVTAGDFIRVKVTRDADGTNGTDDATGDMELKDVALKGRF
jgi:hypothetical protein